MNGHRGAERPAGVRPNGAPLRACFFARVRDRALLDVVDFYRDDIRALRDLGFDVVTATRLSEIDRTADLYFTWWYGSGALSLLASVPRGRPNVFTGPLQLVPELGWWQSLGPVRRGIIRTSIRLASANMGVSGVELGFLRQLGAERSYLVPHGIDTTLYRPPIAPRGESLVMTVSHLTRENVSRKCVTTFIRAIPGVVARVPHARFVVVGSHDTAYPDLLALVRELGVEHAVTFPGRVTTGEKIALYQRASAFAQATRYEGFGVSIAEAMACGLPIVTSPRGAVPEVTGDCARYVEPDDADAMARHLVELLERPDVAAREGARARARIVERFSYEAHRDALARVLVDVLPGWAPPTFVGYAAVAA